MTSPFGEFNYNIINIVDITNSHARDIFSSLVLDNFKKIVVCENNKCRLCSNQIDDVASFVQSHFVRNATTKNLSIVWKVGKSKNL